MTQPVDGDGALPDRGSRLSTIRKLAKALGVDPHELLKEE
jgi:hypothetical protein